MFIRYNQRLNNANFVQLHNRLSQSFHVIALTLRKAMICHYNIEKSPIYGDYV